MININECSPLQLMPEVLRKDPEIQAASYALQETVKLLLSKIDRAVLYAGVDILPETILDLLALELRAQYYDTLLTTEDKRTAVKKAMPWHHKAGTLSAVRELTEFVWKSETTQIQEWFEYNSDPFLFKILLGVDTKMDEGSIEAFYAALWKVKNTRSHLESVTFQRETEQTIHTGTAALRRGNIVISDIWNGECTIQANTYNGATRPHKTQQRIKIREG